MNELVLSLCSYLAFQGSGNVACTTSAPLVYGRTPLKPFIDSQQSYIEARGTALFDILPAHKPLGAMVLIGNDIYKKDYKIPLDNHVFLEYNGSYTCNLHWSW